VSSDISSLCTGCGLPTAFPPFLSPFAGEIVFPYSPVFAITVFWSCFAQRDSRNQEAAPRRPLDILPIAVGRLRDSACA